MLDLGPGDQSSHDADWYLNLHHTKISDDEQKRQEQTDFLTRLRQDHLPDPCHIYYPGWGGDPILEGAFKAHETHYLDAVDYSRLATKGRDFQKSRYKDASFPSRFFDAMLYKDNDAEVAATLGMLRLVKQRGLFIYYYTPNCEYSLVPSDVRKILQLKELTPPYAPRKFLVFKNEPGR